MVRWWNVQHEAEVPQMFEAVPQKMVETRASPVLSAAPGFPTPLSKEALPTRGFGGVQRLYELQRETSRPIDPRFTPDGCDPLDEPRETCRNDDRTWKNGIFVD